MQALILSGGGPLAVAWEVGVLAGLAEAGVQAAEVDFILGTSAGAIVGAQLARGAEPEALAQAVLAEANGVPPPGAMRYEPAAVARLPDLFARAQGSPGNPGAARAEVGAYALSAKTGSETETIARFALSLGDDSWPCRRFGCVAVDALDGAVHILDRDCGASLAAAVAASCSLPGLSPPITVGNRRYIDGGFASTANADLVTGCRSVLVIAFRPAGPSGDRIEARLGGQLAMLRDHGLDVMSILPDAASQAAIGPQTMDLSRRPGITRAGVVQGQAAAERVRPFVGQAGSSTR